MKKFLAALAEAKDIVDVNVAAGMLLERLGANDGPTPKPSPEAKEK